MGKWIELPKDCKTELINIFRDALEVTKYQQKNLPNRECKITSTQGHSQGRAGRALAPPGKWDVMYFLCLNFKK